MSDTIVMRHPTLPKDQEIEVPRDAMPHYTAAGWQRVPAEELDKRAALKAQAEAEARAAEEAADAKTEDQPETDPDASEEPEPESEEASTSRPARSRTRATKKDEEN
ncbi:hypothetical protein [Streptomyces sp. NPDC050534]|uniref:hypothetical protein n=1 Tax=Streptomyces sp. NPDC050534 TaxID=3365625 RepID=UPI003793BD02